MTTRKIGIIPGVYDNLENGRREEYDEHGDQIRSAGKIWLISNRHCHDYARRDFGSLPDVPNRFKSKNRK